MLAIFQVQQCPNVFATSNNNVTATTAITTIGTTLGYKLLSPKMSTAGSALTGTAAYFYVIDEIGFSHNKF
jgi:hypothetical protein